HWHGMPLGIIASVLICTAVAAVSYLAVTQTITQEITDYGSITADNIVLDDVAVGENFSQSFSGAVEVDLGPDGAGRALKMVCTPDSKYTSFGVTITLTSKPEGSTVGLYGYGITGGGEVSVDLDIPGLYTFDQTIEGVAGSSTGTATSTVTFTLETSTTPPRP
ncbi:unnamed protein product, partial [marine sediment metagenome]